MDTSRFPAKGFNYRVIGVDTFAGEDYLIDDFVELKDAIKEAKKHGGNMSKAYIYDQYGDYVGVEFGTF